MICDQTSLSVCRSVVTTPSIHLPAPSSLTTFITFYLQHVSQIPHRTLMTNAFVASGVLSFPQSCSLQSSFALYSLLSSVSQQYRQESIPGNGYAASAAASAPFS